MRPGRVVANDVAASLLDAYSASARVNVYLVKQLHRSVWDAKPPEPKMRTIAAIIAHVHNCGLVYLKRQTPGVPVPDELDRFRVTPAAAARALEAKRRAVLKIVGPALGQSDRIGGSPHDAATFLAYYMAHDAHHRGQIALQARLLGHPVSTETMSKMWQWRA
jgi:uncharacterized damage-inducible protein DinB